MEEDILTIAVNRMGLVDGVKVVKELLARGSATEDEIARTTGMKLNEIRKIMFKLNSFSLVFSESIQDKKTGWLIFYWKTQPEMYESLIRTQKKRVSEKLESRLQYEKSHEFYYCGNDGCVKITFEDAMEYLFKCPKCGKNLEHYNNIDSFTRLVQQVETLRKELQSE